MTRLPILVAVSLFGLTACGLVPDHSLDYRKAPDLPALKLPEGKAMRTPRPLYAIPEIAAARNTVVLTERDGKHEKFLIPAPEPLVTAQPGKVADNGKAGPVDPTQPPKFFLDRCGMPWAGHWKPPSSRLRTAIRVWVFITSNSRLQAPPLNCN